MVYPQIASGPAYGNQFAMKFDEHSELPTDADYIVVENVQDVTLYDVL